MRRALTGLLVLAACATRTQPYRFGSPLLGAADVPPEPLSGVRRPASDVRPDSRTPDSRTPGTRTPDSRTPDTRTPDIMVAPIRVASAAAADAVVESHAIVWSRLPSPHRVGADAPLPPIHAVTDLRALVGRRDKRDVLAIVLGWAHALGEQLEAASGPALVAAAEAAGRLAPPTAPIEPGDLLVFDHTDSDHEADLVALAIARDARGVVELVYVAGGVVRRGFVDPHHAAERRDSNGAVANTFLRAGNRWPPKGTHYLAGELLAHVVHRR
jgi:hypothetical protein